MQIVVLAAALQEAEMRSSLLAEASLVWINQVEEFAAHQQADAFIDLGYVNEASRNALLAALLPKPVIVNSVVHTLKRTNEAFVRINGWRTFLSSPLLEAAASSEAARAKANAVFSVLGKKAEWLPDEPGFVTARVVSMIVNEAYLALAEGVSTKEEINTAMKLGTAYPYGPFEWAEKIGLANIVALLQKLSETQPRYRPAEGLVEGNY